MFDVLANACIYTRLQRSLAPDAAMHRLAALFEISSGQRVLDVGCGPADILAYLPADIDYTGFDASEQYIQAAKRRYGERGTFAVKNISPAAIGGEYDVVIAVGVLHHLADREAVMLFELAANVLRPGGRVITIDGAYVPRQNPIANLLLRLDRGRFVRTEAGYLALARQRFARATATIMHDLLTVPYTHCLVYAE